MCGLHGQSDSPSPSSHTARRTSRPRCGITISLAHHLLSFRSEASSQHNSIYKVRTVRISTNWQICLIKIHSLIANIRIPETHLCPEVCLRRSRQTHFCPFSCFVRQTHSSNQARFDLLFLILILFN